MGEWWDGAEPPGGWRRDRTEVRTLRNDLVRHREEDTSFDEPMARSRIDGGTVRPSAFAAFTLITNSNFVGCSTGRSPGLAP